MDVYGRAKIFALRHWMSYHLFPIRDLVQNARSKFQEWQLLRDLGAEVR